MVSSWASNWVASSGKRFLSEATLLSKLLNLVIPRSMVSFRSSSWIAFSLYSFCSVSTGLRPASNLSVDTPKFAIMRLAAGAKAMMIAAIRTAEATPRTPLMRTNMKGATRNIAIAAIPIFAQASIFCVLFAMAVGLLVICEDMGVVCVGSFGSAEMRKPKILGF
jgi:hypothetical protein